MKNSVVSSALTSKSIKSNFASVIIEGKMTGTVTPRELRATEWNIATRLLARTAEGVIECSLARGVVTKRWEEKKEGEADGNMELTKRGKRALMTDPYKQLGTHTWVTDTTRLSFSPAGTCTSRTISTD